MVNVKQAAQELGKLAMLKFFPSDKEAREGIVQFVCQMAAENSQIAWLVRRVLSTYSEWPGPAELRKVFVSRYRPADGIAVSVCSCGCGKAQTFALAPNQDWPPRLEAPQAKHLLEAAKLTPEEERAERERLAEMFADLKTKPHAIVTKPRKFRDVIAEVETAPKDRREMPGPTPQVITQADIDRAVAELRARRASGDLDE